MSNYLRVGSGILTGVIAAISATKELEKNYGPKNSSPQIGSKVIHEGKEMTVIGFFGGTDKTVTSIDPNREVYYGPKKVAQYYAENRAYVEGGKPTTITLVADKFPSYDDHGAARFADCGPEPLSPEGMRRINVKFVNPEEVTLENKIGFVANVKRMINKK